MGMGMGRGRGIGNALEGEADEIVPPDGNDMF
jgi:hypothetical protein